MSVFIQTCHEGCSSEMLLQCFGISHLRWLFFFLLNVCLLLTIKTIRLLQGIFQPPCSSSGTLPWGTFWREPFCLGKGQHSQWWWSGDARGVWGSSHTFFYRCRELRLKTRAYKELPNACWSLLCLELIYLFEKGREKLILSGKTTESWIVGGISAFHSMTFFNV